jgi:hypothetical protein
MTGKFLTIALSGLLIAGGSSLAFAQSATNWHRQGLRATRALNLLENRSDGQFSNFRADGADFAADVTKNGKVMAVLIKPDQRQIQTVGDAG